MATKKSIKKQLQDEIKLLENQKELIIQKKMEEFIKNDPKIQSINQKLESYTRLLKRKEDHEKRALELDKEMKSALKGE